jgi:hypothetical protein
MVISNKYKFIFIKTSKIGGTSLELFLSGICGENDILTPLWHAEKEHIARNFKKYFNPFPEIGKRIWNEKRINNIGLKNTLSNFLDKDMYFENIPAWQLKCRIPKNIWDNYYKFTVERNPWDKCVSRYFHCKTIFEEKHKKELSFDMWYKYFQQRLNEPWVTTAWGSESPYNYPRYCDPWTNEILVDYVCRYENLNDELKKVFTLLGISFNGLQQYKAKSHYRKDRRPYQDFLDVKYADAIGDVFKKEIDLMKYTF